MLVYPETSESERRTRHPALVAAALGLAMNRVEPFPSGPQISLDEKRLFSGQETRFKIVFLHGRTRLKTP
ncbi:hypothetical protein GCM10027176_11300 [Actinoallomurus bryophytorum]